MASGSKKTNEKRTKANLARVAPKAPDRAAAGTGIGRQLENSLGASHEAGRKAAKGDVVNFPRKVMATRDGYYGHARRREGDVFILEGGDHRGSWMEVVDAGTPPRHTGAQAALDRKHDEITDGAISNKESRLAAAKRGDRNLASNPIGGSEDE